MGSCTFILSAGLEQLEANELLALLANLGAQQQAVLAAITERQQPAFQSNQNPLQHSTRAVPAGRHIIDISVAAGDMAMAAQQHKH